MNWRDEASTKPAQSDAPSAAELAWLEWRLSAPVYSRWGASSEHEKEVCEAYAVLRTAQWEKELRVELKKTLTLCDEETVIGGIRNLAQAHVLNKSSLEKYEAKVAQLERERDGWKESDRMLQGQLETAYQEKHAAESALSEAREELTKARTNRNCALPVF